MIPAAILEMFALLLGLIFGSFITMASWRLPLRQNWMGRSKCPVCSRALGFRDLVPVFSWLMSKGRCRGQGCKIPVRYPLIELTCGLLFMLAVAQYGISLDSLFLAFLAVLLLLMTVIDLEHQIIPDSLNIALAISGLAWQVFKGGDIGLALLAGFLLGFISWLTAVIMEKILQKDALGGGDIKFLAAAGLWTGFWPLPWLLILGGVLGVLLGLIWRFTKHKSAAFPFAPSLCAALFIIILFYEFFNEQVFLLLS